MAWCCGTSTPSIADESIIVDPNNEQIAGLAKAAADGGGEIKVGIKGYKRLQTMQRSTKEITIDDFHAEGSPAYVLKAIKAATEMTDE